jgi:hypothetical protein
MPGAKVTLPPKRINADPGHRWQRKGRVMESTGISLDPSPIARRGEKIPIIHQV